MKISILYYSKTGKTAEMAREIAAGVEQEPGCQAGVFSLEEMDLDFVRESAAVMVGTPTWVASTTWHVKKFFDEDSKDCALAGKLGGAFATANYPQGGADIAIQTILEHMLVKGMVVYSSGASLGQPYIHLGPVALKDQFEESRELFRIYGRRMAQKARELFGE
ncbi:flavodoxin family protein [Angelakisella massiliensis]|uniref:flavodoxin family protein n=1 Tax=Angelakisella massiliensis TaxID=1871018 RepID=UPI0023A81998|nr:flavodoxin domain-containing protein [Angelakisella massiliensis]